MFSVFEGGMAAKKPGEEIEGESHRSRVTAEEAAHGFLPLHPRAPEKPALEAASGAGMWSVPTGGGEPSRGGRAWTVLSV